MCIRDRWIIDKCEEVEQASQHGNSHKIFRTIKELCGKFLDNIQCVKNVQGNIIQDKQGIFKRWKEHFETLYNEQNPTDRTVLATLPSTNSTGMGDFLTEEVTASIKRLKKNKSPGLDNITAEMVKAGEEVSVDMLHTLCNEVCREGKCPEDWGKAIFIPIH